MHRPPTDDLARAVERARDGDHAALATVVGRLKDGVYRLAIRMLYHPADAEDATQEILIKVVTHLSSFRGEADVTSWAYRIAANHLLTTRQRRAEQRALTFAQCEQAVAQAARDSGVPEEARAERKLLLKEMRVSCLHGLLMCLDRKHRIAFLLGEVFELTSDEAAAVLEVSPETHRQRLSRARASMLAFLSKNCSLVRDDAPCTCERQLGQALSTGMVRPHRLLFATHPSDNPERIVPEAEVDELGRIAKLYRELPSFTAPGSIQAALRRALGEDPNTEPEAPS